MRPIHWRLELGVDRVPALGVCTYRWDIVVILLMHAEVLLPRNTLEGSLERSLASSAFPIRVVSTSCRIGVKMVLILIDLTAERLVHLLGPHLILPLFLD